MNLLIRFDATGLSRHLDPYDIRNLVEFEDAWLDGNTDVTDALNDACDALRAGRFDFWHRPRLVLPPGKYKISATVNCDRVGLYAPQGAWIIADPALSGPALTWAQAQEWQWPSDMPPCAENIRIFGGTGGVSGGTYVAGSLACDLSAPYLRLKNVNVEGFEDPFLIGKFGYIIELSGCKVTNCKFGLRLSKSFPTSGENIRLENCSLSNNEIGFSINHNQDTNVDGVGDGQGAQLSLWFNNCSLDYNTVRHGEIFGPGVFENDHLAQVTFTDCHFETSANVSGKEASRIVNEGVLILKGCNFYEASEYESIIETTQTGRTVLMGNFFAVPGNGPWCSGQGLYKVSGNLDRYGTHPVRITDTILDA